MTKSNKDFEDKVRKEIKGKGAEKAPDPRVLKKILDKANKKGK